MESESIFSRVFSYRQKENMSPKENFLTEIFAFVLKNDVDVFKSFCDLIEQDFCRNNIDFNNKNYTVKTQKPYPEGIPDIKITISDDTIILIECKVESKEGEGQLENYNQILETHFTDKKNKHLIYLTKYYEDNEKVKLIRWYQIYDLIENTSNRITQQFKKYLKEENMNIEPKFTTDNIVTLNNIGETISKMDDILDTSKKHAKKLNGVLLQEHRTLKLKDNGYYFRIEFDLFWLNIGFWHNKSELSFCIEIENYENNDENELKSLKKGLKSLNKLNWTENNENNYIKVKLISENQDIGIIINFLKETIDELVEIKENNNEIFKS